MAGKSAYEIRADLLSLAFQILRTKMEAECNAEAAEGELCTITKAPSTDQIILEADKLNDFVSTKAS